MKQDHFKEIGALAPSGFFLAFHYVQSGPEYHLDTFPAAWRKKYEKHSYHWLDPVVVWIAFNNGTRRWSDINLPDPRRVLAKSLKHGLKYGAVCVQASERGKHFLSIAREDREYTDTELEELSNLLTKAVELYHASPLLTDAEIAVLQILANDNSIAETAKRLNISQSSVKDRLSRAKKRLDCKYNHTAIFRAQQRKLIS